MEETLHKETAQEQIPHGETTAEDPAVAETAAQPETPPEETVPRPEETEDDREKAEKLQEELDTVSDRLLRVLAEYDNFRKRTAKEKEELSAFTVSSVISGLLPVLDNFERAMEAGCSDEEFGKGMQLILQQFKEYLTKNGIAEIPTDIPFDPELHNAVMHVEDENLGENAIAMVLQKGYTIGDKVIRHAMVSVAN